MKIPVNGLTWTAALLPILVLLILLLIFQWSAARAAIAGMVVTVVTGFLVYKATPFLIVAEGAKGVWNAFIILIIVWTAVLLYQVGEEAGAYRVIRSGMRKLFPNELMLVLTMGWIFESFLQGITGFGVPVAVGAPLLTGLGVTPLYAIVIPLLGQAWGNTFGTLGAAWDSLVLSAGLVSGSKEYVTAALWTAAFIWLWDFVCGFAVCWFYGKWRAVKKGLPAVVLLAMIQGGGEFLMARVNTTICCFIPACLSLLAALLLGRTSLYNREWSVQDSPMMSREGSEGKTVPEEETENQMTLVQAFAPYFFLSVLSLTVLLCGPLNRCLGRFVLTVHFPETQTGYGFVNVASEGTLAPLTHASMFLLLSALGGIVYYSLHGWIREGGVRRIFVRSFSMICPSAVSIIALVIMSKIMDGCGQTQVLANGIAGVLGKAYMLLAPFIGFLGTFMTGSNMSSNILFGGFQMTTAKLLHTNVAAVLGAQSAGGCIGSAVSPSKIVLGTTTAGIVGEEGKVLKKVMVITLPAIAGIGILLFLLAA